VIIWINMGCRVMKPQTHGAKITPSVPWRPRLVESRHVNHTIIGERVRITFSDGEVIVGYRLHFDVNGPGFLSSRRPDEQQPPHLCGERSCEGCAAGGVRFPLNRETRVRETRVLRVRGLSRTDFHF